MDFTLKKYEELIKELKAQSYVFLTVRDFLKSDERHERIVMLRHDVDKRPVNSLNMAVVEHSHGIPATYYFRILKCSFVPEIIKQISGLEHEIGYHYEDLTLAKGDVEKALALFEKNLMKLRTVADIDTICMHGAPLFKWDNKDIWKRYNYRDYDIIGEPYFDIDFDKFYYLTDTGRSWKPGSYNIRDKVNKRSQFNFNSTDDIIRHVKEDKFPNHVMINTHPQRWHNNLIGWTSEAVGQNIKNQIKIIISKTR